MGSAALPAIVLRKEHNLGAPATRADDAIRPTASHKEFSAVSRIGEVQNRFLQSGRNVSHALIIGVLARFVNYIVTLPLVAALKNALFEKGTDRSVRW
jgi:hypothetical protein